MIFEPPLRGPSGPHSWYVVMMLFQSDHPSQATATAHWPLTYCHPFSFSDHSSSDNAAPFITDATEHWVHVKLFNESSTFLIIHTYVTVQRYHCFLKKVIDFWLSHLLESKAVLSLNMLSPGKDHLSVSIIMKYIIPSWLFPHTLFSSSSMATQAELDGRTSRCQQS